MENLDFPRVMLANSSMFGGVSVHNAQGVLSNIIFCDDMMAFITSICACMRRKLFHYGFLRELDEVC